MSPAARLECLSAMQHAMRHDDQYLAAMQPK
jgi:hypothetical protein